ncbi:MAG: UDP-N-acetylglucosamine 4,6-dehydratase [Gemmatimonadetes bacterium]|nr:UDP-N-acetylglucosamine 4,6-dehydratase [Gemmatimonadota bacterium]
MSLLTTTLVRSRRALILGLHLALVPLAYWIAFQLRFDFAVPREQMARFYDTLPYLLAIRMGAFAVFGLYHGWWRHVGMRDLTDLVKAITLSSGLFLLTLFFRAELSAYPRSILCLDWAAALMVFGGIRFAGRAFREQRFSLGRVARGKRTLVIGAGIAADRFIRHCHQDGGGKAYPVGLVDDDPMKLGMRMHGVRVLGTAAEVPAIVARGGVELLVIAIPSATRKQMQDIVASCIATGLEFKIVPSVWELLEGRKSPGELRPVQLEDLLGRDAIEIGMDGPRAEIRGKVVLVTGGSGSIGAELARQVASLGPTRLVLLDQAESPLYFTHLEMQRAYPGVEVVPVIADVTDQTRVERVFAQHRPHFVFHAAAYKHVPLMEDNVMEAARNNVLGTLCVAQAAAACGAEKFVLISTDKAVYPSSVMGASKRVAEQIVLGWPGLRASATDFRAVRFGNVLGSDGSVIPLFRRQLAMGKPLTVTHPEVTRYFMTIPEAVQLVLHCAALDEASGRIAMLEMGEPVRIVELAENLIRLCGMEPYRDVPIVFTGLRPGEKLHEELMSQREETIPTAVSKVRIVQTDEPDAPRLTSGLDRLAASVALGSENDVLAAICALVPECVSPLRERGRAAARVT